MKDMKVKNKLLFGFGILIFFMLVVSALAVLGLRSLHQENTTLVEKTLANTEYVWEMRRNLMSEQRYELMIFAENDPEQTREMCIRDSNRRIVVAILYFKVRNIE